MGGFLFDFYWHHRDISYHYRHIWRQKLPLPVGKSGPESGSLDLSNVTSEAVSRLLQKFLHSSSRSVPILYNGLPLPPLKIAHSHVGCRPHVINWFLWPTQVLNPKVILIGSAIFAGLTTVTDRPRYAVGNNRPYLAMLRCGLITV